jgi:CRP-like cAMP-binding protein
VIDWLEEAEIDAAGTATAGSGPAEPGADLNRGLTVEWAGDGEKQDPLATTGLFRALDPAQGSKLARDSQIRTAAVGEPVTTRWSAGRDFFVILEGRARVERGDEVVGEIGPGEFFGELAALDWGAGYGYVRTATVRATEPLTLLVVPAERLNALLAEVPALAAEIEATVRERLSRS